MMKMVTVALLLFHTIMLGPCSGRPPASDDEFLQYVVEAARTNGLPVTMADLTASPLDERTRLALDRFSAEQLVEACRKMEIYSLRAVDLKNAIVQLLVHVAVRDTDYDSYIKSLLDLKKEWGSQSVVPDPDLLRVRAGRAIIESLENALSVTRTRSRFRDTATRMKQLADQLVLLTIRLPEGELRVLPAEKAVVTDILSASVPEKMSPIACPLLARGHKNPWLTSAELDRARARVVEDGFLVFISNGSTPLATLLYYDFQLMYFRDIHGLMESALICDSPELIRLLREK